MINLFLYQYCNCNDIH